MKIRKLLLIMLIVILALSMLSLTACLFGDSSEVEDPAVDDPTDVDKTYYTVSFDSNGGSTIDSIQVESGLSIAMPTDPTRYGYTFAGWYEDNSNTSFDFDGTVTCDVELIAKWTAIEYSIIYVGFDGVANDNTATTYTIESDTIEFIAPTKTGYTATLDVTSIAKGSTGNITVTASWALTEYSITYVGFDGVANDNTATSYTIESDTIQFVAPTKLGYISTLDVTSIAKGSTGNITVTANWTPIEYSITYVGFDGATNTNASTYTIEDAIQFVAPTKTGYTATLDVTTIAKGSTGAVTVTASWAPTEYSITYVGFDGVTNDNTATSYTMESDTIEFVAPIKTGYISTLDVTSIVKGSTGAVTVTATWLLTTDGLSYTLNSDGLSYTVSGIGTATDTDIVIPNTYNNLPVTSIGDSAFYSRISLTSVVISDSVTSIGEDAFWNCYSLTSVVISDSVTSIGEGAFGSCTKLTSITIGSGVTSIDAYAFYGCSSLTSIIIPVSVINIDTSVFNYCDSLADVYYNGTISDWCYISFDGYASNPMAFAENFYMLDDGEYCLVTEIVISDSVTAIGDYQFYSFDCIISVTIGGSVTSIGSHAFDYCSNLLSVAIGDTVTSIGGWAFYECSNLTSVTIGNSVTSIGSAAFYYCSSLTSIVIPDSVVSLGDSVFWYCSSMTSAIIGDNVTSIGGGLFGGCTSLTSVVIPDSVVSLGERAFMYCSSLTSIVIPDGVISIGTWAFADCTNLTSVTIGNSVTSIGDYAFGWCSSLTSIAIPDSVTSIGTWAFVGCENMCHITIGTGVTVIGDYAFIGCYKLVEIYNLSGISMEVADASISFVTYYALDIYTSLDEPSKLTSQDGFILYTSNDTIKTINYIGSDSIVTVPSYVDIVGYSTFRNNTSITSVVIPEGVTSIDMAAFYGCTGLVSITIPSTVSYMGAVAFSGCTSLVNVYYCGTVADWCGITFVNMQSTPMELASNFYMLDDNGEYYIPTEITVPDTVTALLEYTFYGFDIDIVINIPDSVVDIADAALSSYTITWIIDGVATYTTVACGDTPTYDGTPTKDSSTLYTYTFEGWDVEITSAINNATYTAQFSSQTRYYTVSFDTDCDTDIDSQSVQYNGYIVEPTNPTKYGYTFAGWYEENSNTAFDFDNAVTCDIELTAKWTATEYSITYVGFDGVTNENTATTYTIESDAIQFVAPTKTGYTATLDVTSISKGSTGTVTVTASWTPIEYSITYVGFDGATNTNVSTYTIEDAIQFVAPTKAGYTATLDIGSIAKGSTGDVIVTASWTPIEYSITYVGFEGATNTNVSTYTIEDAIQFVLPTKLGYTATLDVTSIAKGTTGNITVTASWTPIEYSITYVGFEGATNTNVSTYTIEDAIEFVAPTKTGYTATLDITSIAKGSTGNIIVTATWKQTTEGLSYTLNSNGQSYIVSGIGTATDTDIVIPSTYNNLPVTSIGDSSFYSCISLTSVIIPSSVVSIGEYAFYGCCRLQELTIGSGVTSIGSYAFQYCTSLETVYYNAINADYTSNVSRSLYYDDNAPFRYSGSSAKGCQLIIGDNVESIGYYMFYDFDYLTTVIIGKSVTSIDEWAFDNCSSLTDVCYTGTIADWCGISFAYYTANPMYYASNFYMLDDNGNYGLVTEIVIPDSVIVIGGYQFYGLIDVTSIIIPDSVVSIDNYAFYSCTSLTSIVIPDGVTTIEDSVFYYCSSLTSIVIPDAVTSLGNYAFSNCSSLTSIVIPDSVTSIGTWAFRSCTSLTSVIIGDSVTSMGAYAFCGCNSLTSVVIPDGVTTIEGSVFYYCSSLTSVAIPDAVTSLGNYAFSNCSSLTSIVIPDGVTTIEDSVFSYCSSLTSIVIPDGVTSIDSYAFSNCSSLTSIVIPDSVTSIGTWAFRSCTSLTSVIIGDSVTSMGAYAFCGCNSLTSVVIPDGVTTIEDSVFYYCSSLTSVVISDGVTSIGDDAFYDCSSLTSVTIPDSVTSIGNNAFESCSSLTSIVIPDGVTSIGYEAFYNCTNLTSIVILASVTSIGGSTFYGCSSLIDVYYNGTIDNWCGINFGGSYASPMYYADNLYMLDDEGEYDLVTEIVIPDNVTVIGNYQFYGFSCATSITIPDSVVSFGNYAFDGCSNLTNIVIPDTVTSIGSFAFYGCCNLTSIVIPDGVTSIGSSAFYGCCNLTSIVIPDSVASIDNYAFYYCSSLTSVTIPDSVVSLGHSAFYGCCNLTSIVIPDGVTSIGSSAFYGCSSLISVIIPDSVTSIGYEAFYNCTVLTDIVMGDGVIRIDYYAFSNCTSLTDLYYNGTIADWCGINFYGYPIYYASNFYMLDGDGNYYLLTELVIPDSLITIDKSQFSGFRSITSVVIPDSVTSIGDYAFSNCTSLTSVVVPDSVVSIGSYAFYECSSLTSITIPDSVTIMGYYVFYGCTSLTSVVFEDTSTWYRTTSSSDISSMTGGTATIVSNASTAATYLKSTYCDYFWYKV